MLKKKSIFKLILLKNFINKHKLPIKNKTIKLNIILKISNIFYLNNISLFFFKNYYQNKSLNLYNINNKHKLEYTALKKLQKKQFYKFNNKFLVYLLVLRFRKKYKMKLSKKKIDLIKKSNFLKKTLGRKKFRLKDFFLKKTEIKKKKINLKEKFIKTWFYKFKKKVKKNYRISLNKNKKSLIVKPKLSKKIIFLSKIPFLSKSNNKNIFITDKQLFINADYWKKKANYYSLYFLKKNIIKYEKTTKLVSYKNLYWKTYFWKKKLKKKYFWKKIKIKKNLLKKKYQIANKYIKLQNISKFLEKQLKYFQVKKLNNNFNLHLLKFIIFTYLFKLRFFKKKYKLQWRNNFNYIFKSLPFLTRKPMISKDRLFNSKFHTYLNTLGTVDNTIKNKLQKLQVSNKINVIKYFKASNLKQNKKLFNNISKNIKKNYKIDNTFKFNNLKLKNDKQINYTKNIIITKSLVKKKSLIYYSSKYMVQLSIVKGFNSNQTFKNNKLLVLDKNNNITHNFFRLWNIGKKANSLLYNNIFTNKLAPKSYNYSSLKENVLNKYIKGLDSQLFRIWSLHLLNYNYSCSVIKTNILNIRFKSFYTSTFLKKFYIEFFWIRKYLTKTISKQKVTLSWILFLITKDPKFIIKIIFNILVKSTFKKHKYILIKIKRLLNFFSGFLKSQFLVSSIWFEIKGKIGVKGSAKKKKLKYRGGKGIPNSRKDLKATRSSFLIYTDTGVLGCLLKMTYY